MPEPAPHSELAPELTSKLQHYRELQLQEKQLRQLVHILARQEALHGPLLVPAKLLLELEAEREKLNDLRAEIERLEEELKQEQHAYDDAKAAGALEWQLHIRQQRIERLVSDIKHKREQAQIYERHIHFLEQKEAQMGLHTPLNILSEIDEIARQLERVRQELQTEEQQLQDRYQIVPERLKGVEQFSERELAKFVQEIVTEIEGRGPATRFTRTRKYNL